MNKWFILFICLSAVALVATGCKKGDKGKNMSIIDKSTQEKVTKMLADSSQIADKERIARGVAQAAAFWTKEDGTIDFSYGPDGSLTIAAKRLAGAGR